MDGGVEEERREIKTPNHTRPPTQLKGTRVLLPASKPPVTSLHQNTSRPHADLLRENRLNGDGAMRD